MTPTPTPEPGITLNIREQLEDFFKFTEIEQIGPLISKIIGLTIVIAAILLLFYLIFSGIQWLTSGGEKTAVAAARSRMTAAFIGLLIVLSAWAIFTLVKYMFAIPPVPKGGPTGPPAGQIDCCTWGGRSPDCCDFLQSKEPPTYVHGRYQSSWEKCQEHHWVDWSLWEQNYWQEVEPDEHDPCGG